MLRMRWIGLKFLIYTSNSSVLGVINYFFYTITQKEIKEI